MHNLAHTNRRTLVKGCDKVLDNLAVDIANNFQFVDERTVLNILNAVIEIQYVSGDWRNTQNLIKKLNDFVTEMAIRQPELVEMSFLATYLHRISQIRNGAFQVRVSNELKSMIGEKLLETGAIEKLSPRSAKEILESSLIFKQTGNFSHLASELFAKDQIQAPESVQKVYQMIRQENDAEKKQQYNDQALAVIENYFDKVSDARKNYNAGKCLFNALVFPKSDKRDALVAKLEESFDPKSLSD